MIKGLSLYQPYASLIGRGKNTETRGTRFNYRGPLAIHAAKRWTGTEVARTSACGHYLWGGGPSSRNERDIPLGAIVSVVTVVSCIPTGRITMFGYRDWGEYNLETWETDGAYSISADDFALGDYRPGRFGIVLKDIRLLPEPVLFRGRQGIFNVDLPELEEWYRAETSG